LNAEAGFQAISPDYFQTLGIPLLRGRSISVDDREASSPVAVVSRSFANKYAPGSDPIGWRFTRGLPMPNGSISMIPLVTIVGVVEDVRRGKTEPVIPEVYLSASQFDLYPVRLAELAVRTAGEPHSFVDAVKHEIWAIDPLQPVTNIRTLDEVLLATLAERRFNVALIGSFAALALSLALIGIYGVVSSATTQRSREFAVRFALGATSANIIKLAMASGVIWCGVGLAIGMGGALAASRAIRGMLFDIAPTDPLTLGVVSVAMAAVALVACYLPAKRAAALEPIAVLRGE
jgi:hypothetical protein